METSEGWAIKQVTSVGNWGSVPQGVLGPLGACGVLFQGPSPRTRELGCLSPTPITGTAYLLPGSSISNTSSLLHAEQRSFQKPEKASGSGTQVLPAGGWTQVDRHGKGQGDMGGMPTAFVTVLHELLSLETEALKGSLAGKRQGGEGFRSHQMTTKPAPDVTFCGFPCICHTCKEKAGV